MKEKKDNKEKIEQNSKKTKKAKENKNKKPNKIIEVIKTKWLVKGSTTFLFILSIIFVFVAINFLMQKLELAPIDFTEEKLYTLTNESKEKVKNIDKEVNLYFIGYSEDSNILDLANQYKKVNEKIKPEAIDINNRPDLAQKYGIDPQAQQVAIIVECGEKSKVLSQSDLVTYDITTYETIDISEERLTRSIVSVTSEKVPKVYFLLGYSQFSLNQNMNYLNIYLGNEINEIKTLNILTEGKVPDDCDTLVITTPSKDFDDIATNAIINYIQSGRNILWMNAAVTTTQNMPNVNKILEMYCVKPFEVGIIRETNPEKMLSGSSDFIIPDMQYDEITKDIYNTTGVILINATKINIDENKLEESKVEKTDLLQASSNSYFRTDFNKQSDNAEEGEAKGTFLVGAKLEKTITEKNEETNTKAVTSKLIIYGENYFISDYPLSQNSQYAAIQLNFNKDLVLNSIAYLVDREEDITARKSTGAVTYSPTEMQDIIIKIIIFTVPVLIVIAGIIVWQIRRRKK